MSTGLRVALASGLLVALVSCGGVTPHQHAQYEVKPMLGRQAEALKAAKGEIGALRAEVGTLRRQITALERRLSPVEQRTGLGAFDPAQLDQLRDPNTQLKTRVDAVVLSGRAAKPEKRRLDAHLAQYDGAVFAFWATWCVPCIADEELALVKRLRDELARYDVALISMAIDELELVQAHKKALKWVYPLWHRKNGHLELLPRAFVEQAGVGLPLFVVVSRSGAIRWFHNKALDEQALRDLVTAAVLDGRL